MSKPATVFDALMTRLQADSTLSGYVKQFLEGEREIDSVTQFPTLMVDYLGSSEEDDTYGVQRITMRAAIILVINVSAKEKQITGDTATRGALDYLNDIKKAIDGDRTLGGVAIHTAIREDNFTTVNFPVRALSVNLEILFEQTESVRT